MSWVVAIVRHCRYFYLKIIASVLPADSLILFGYVLLQVEPAWNSLHDLRQWSESNEGTNQGSGQHPSGVVRSCLCKFVVVWLVLRSRLAVWNSPFGCWLTEAVQVFSACCPHRWQLFAMHHQSRMRFRFSFLWSITTESYTDTMQFHCHVTSLLSDSGLFIVYLCLCDGWRHVNKRPSNAVCYAMLML